MKIAFLVIAVLAVVCSVQAGETTVWQIGQFDNNYEELAIPHNSGGYLATFPNDVTFRPGKDDASKSWPFIHPGPVDGWGGARTHPFTVVFDLPEQPRGASAGTGESAFLMAEQHRLQHCLRDRRACTPNLAIIEAGRQA